VLNLNKQFQVDFSVRNRVLRTVLDSQFYKTQRLYDRNIQVYSKNTTLIRFFLLTNEVNSRSSTSCASRRRRWSKYCSNWYYYLYKELNYLENAVCLVHEAVVLNNIPAVFLEGTGRCCDLFAKAVRLYNDAYEKLEITEEQLAS